MLFVPNPNLLVPPTRQPSPMRRCVHNTQVYSRKETKSNVDTSLVPKATVRGGGAISDHGQQLADSQPLADRRRRLG